MRSTLKRSTLMATKNSIGTFRRNTRSTAELTATTDTTLEVSVTMNSGIITAENIESTISSACRHQLNMPSG